MKPAIAVLVSLILTGPAWAQAPDPPAPASSASGDAARLTVAMSGIVVVGAGFGMMLHETWRQVAIADPRPGPDPTLIVGCYCSDPKWIVAGTVVVAAGVTMTWLGLRPRTVTIAPAIGPQRLGALGVIRWGSPRRTHHAPATALPAPTPPPSTAPPIGALPPA